MLLVEYWGTAQFAADRKGCWKMFKLEILSALWAEKLSNEKRKEFCGTPCIKTSNQLGHAYQNEIQDFNKAY